MIETRGLTKRFGSLMALSNLTLDIGPGEIFGFIGPNGAGKTTTMKILACLLKPDLGKAKVCGFDIAGDQDKIRRVIGYMPDFLGVYDDLTVDEYLQFFAAAYGIQRSNRPTVIGQVLELTDLKEKRHTLVDGLSRGMQQRLGVARVLIHDPKVLFLDEPASGLDPRARIEMRSLLGELGKMGKTLMVSSHILSELGEMSTCIGIIEKGELLYAGSMQDALARTRAASHVGQRVHIVLREHSAGAGLIAERLRTAEFIEEVKGDDATRTLDVAFKQGSESQHELFEVIAGLGGKVESFEPQQVRLEDAFLKLTTGALQ